MIEKKIKNFYNSVTVCGEQPTPKKHTRLAPMGIAIGTVCAIAGILAAILLMEHVGEEEAE